MGARRVLSAALSYFALVFVVGFGFGVVRELWAQPMLGERGAELAELPLMIGVVILAAMWVVTRFFLGRSLGARLATGLLALLLLVGAEVAIVLYVRDPTLEEYVASRDQIAFSAYLGSLFLFALMPALVRTRRG